MLEGTTWEKTWRCREANMQHIFHPNQIRSTLQEQCDSEVSHGPTGEDPKAQSDTPLILAAMASHWVFLVGVSLGPFRC